MSVLFRLFTCDFRALRSNRQLKCINIYSRWRWRQQMKKKITQCLRARHPSQCVCNFFFNERTNFHSLAPLYLQRNRMCVVKWKWKIVSNTFNRTQFSSEVYRKSTNCQRIEWKQAQKNVVEAAKLAYSHDLFNFNITQNDWIRERDLTITYIDDFHICIS